MRFINLEACEPGMVVERNIQGPNGMLLIRHNTPLKQNHLDTLKRMGYPGVYIADANSKGINVTEVVDATSRIQASSTIQDIFTKSKFSSSIPTSADLKEVDKIVDDMASQIIANKNDMINLIELKSQEDYLYQHCVDVCILSMILGREFKMVRSNLVQLGKAAIFHDIGKVFAPQNILNKPTALTPDEYDEMKKHPQVAHDFLKDQLSQPKIIFEAVLHHHERFDGGSGGYPGLAKGEEIPLYARIIAVANMYDSVTTKKIYKDAMIPTEACEYISAGSGTMFDPEVVDAFLRKIPPFPVGSGVELSDGRKAIVAENRTNSMSRPLVRIFKHSEEAPDIMIDLATDALSLAIIGTF